MTWLLAIAIYLAVGFGAALFLGRVFAFVSRFDPPEADPRASQTHGVPAE